MSDIVLSAGVRSNLLQLQQTSTLISQTQTRLATGKRVNSALDNALNFFTAQGLDILAASTDLTAALTSLRSESQTLSANLSTVQIRQDFTKATINTLQTGSADLTLADSNEEGANLLALQTRQQLSTTALSLAAQASQAVLRLFQ